MLNTVFRTPTEARATEDVSFYPNHGLSQDEYAVLRSVLEGKNPLVTPGVLRCRFFQPPLGAHWTVSNIAVEYLGRQCSDFLFIEIGRASCRERVSSPV